MPTLRAAPFALALLVASSAAASASSFTRITWNTSGTSRISKAQTRLTVEASGQARLERVPGEGAVHVGAPEEVLRGRLAPAELAALDQALGAPGWDRLPRMLASGFNGARLELSIERPGRPTLRAEGFAGRYGDQGALLDPVDQVLSAVKNRLKATSTELSLTIDRVNLPSMIRADEDLEVVVSGRGQPGVQFTSLRAVLSGRSLRIEALGRQVALAPAQPFSQRLRVERPARVGLGYLHVSYTGERFGPWVLIVQSETAAWGRYTGQVVKKKGQVNLRIQVAPRETRLRPLNDAAAARLGRFEGEYVHFDGRLDASGRLEIQRLIRPERRRIEGLALHYGSIRAEGLGHVSTFGPVQKVLQGIEPGTPVEVEGWFFSEGGFPGPRKWHETGGRSLYRAQRLYAERVRATASQTTKLKQGWRSSGELQAGDEVWITKRRLFGWSVDVETRDGKAGRARFKKRFDFARPLKLASEGGGAGIVGALSGS